MGLLAGVAFVLFCTLAGIPIARLADRASRKHIIAASLVSRDMRADPTGQAPSRWRTGA